MNDGAQCRRASLASAHPVQTAEPKSAGMPDFSCWLEASNFSPTRRHRWSCMVRRQQPDHTDWQLGLLKATERGARALQAPQFALPEKAPAVPTTEWGWRQDLQPRPEAFSRRLVVVWTRICPHIASKT